MLWAWWSICGKNTSSDHSDLWMCSSTGHKNTPVKRHSPFAASWRDSKNALWLWWWWMKSEGKGLSLWGWCQWHDMRRYMPKEWLAGLAAVTLWPWLFMASSYFPSHCFWSSLDISTRGLLSHTVISSLSKVWTPVLILSLYRIYSPACYDYRSLWALINQCSSGGIT